MGNAALLRNSFVEALNYRLKREKAAAKGESEERHLAREALLPVLDGEVPLSVHAHRADDIVTALRIAKEFDLRITLEHCTEGHLIASFLAEHRARAAVGPTLTGKPKIELRFKTWDTPLALHRAGVHFCIITDHPVVPIEHLSVCAALAVRAGLPREEALRAVTLSAAEHLDLADRLGSLDPGKDADLALWDGDPLDARSRVVTTVIDGEPVWRRR
jgi:imidazolonepropionase-like amidohydrolase